jgi:hypothetical protein
VGRIILIVGGFASLEIIADDFFWRCFDTGEP